MLQGLCKQAEGVYDIANNELVTGHVAEFASGTSGTKATRVAPPGHPQPLLTQWCAMGSGDAWPGPAVPNHVASVRWRDCFPRERRMWAAKCRNSKHGRCFLMRSGKSCAGRPLGFDGSLAKELFAESTAGAPLRSSSTLRRWSVFMVGSYDVSQWNGPSLTALELPLENPHEAEPMCVSWVWYREAKFSNVLTEPECSFTAFAEEGDCS